MKTNFLLKNEFNIKENIFNINISVLVYIYKASNLIKPIFI